MLDEATVVEFKASLRGELIQHNYKGYNERIIAWTKEYWDALHPHSAGGAYVNFMMDEGQDRVKATYRDNYDRLVAVKNKYDPTNLYRVNPVPRTYVRGFGALPLQGGRNIHPRAYARGVLWYGVNQNIIPTV